MGNPSRMVATSTVISKLKDSSLKELSESGTRQSHAIPSFHFAVFFPDYLSCTQRKMHGELNFTPKEYLG